MYKGLYDSFKHWFHNGQVYFYSDPHFGDEEMKYIRKNYIGDEEQIKRINSKIGKNDTIVILGDVGDVEWVKKIRGYKVLVQGNHDVGATKYQKLCWYENKEDHTLKIYTKECARLTSEQMRSEWKTCSNYLFDEVYEGCLMISDKIILSHEPVDFKYALNIHGHDHSGWEKQDSMHFNVCAEHINYTPVCLKDIIEGGKIKNIPNVHRETIDEATAKKKKKFKK